MPTTKPGVEKRDAQKETESAEQKESAQSSPTVSTGSRDKVKATTQDERNHPYDPTKDTLYRCYLVATIIGVVGFFAGIGVLIWQTVLTRITANVARDAANAARSSAEATVNSERPWLFINIAVTSQANSDSIFPPRVPEHLGFSVSFRNWGKTPAEVVAFVQRPDCREDPDDFPSSPEYSLDGHVMAHTRMVPPGETWRDPGGSSFWVEEFLPEDQWQDIRNSRQGLVYWGRLQYRDLIEESKTVHELKRIGTIHETCFCYCWSPTLNEFLKCGPLGYNKHT